MTMISEQKILKAVLMLRRCGNTYLSGLGNPLRIDEKSGI